MYGLAMVDLTQFIAHGRVKYPIVKNYLFMTQCACCSNQMLCPASIKSTGFVANVGKQWIFTI
jgi:hypothetical protein